ncbi:amino acid/amide ABC transporter substrate-binding protein, HAAT family [Rhodoferax sp. OV413]|uniref:ABC transporter substrate-binding protein n=1 Tax=Rhodoferax sp. OV413 TaxID=1855285 RepID=UPI0008865D45|nr:ABC transporter substrate-binding protein [Rhodoferax sp. OV413]SDP72079.1 amino acid/amide ABC transporter substrate-binding protein, HAAT family [Rhodoferax sp. OV413]
MKFQRRTLIAAATATVLCSTATVWAQGDPVKIFNVVELSGAGATAGTMFKSGIELAVKDINAAGGILGRKIEVTNMDTQTNPGVAKGLVVRAIDDGAFAIFGPVFTGSILISQTETRRAEVPNFTAAAGALVTQQGSPYIFRTGLTQVNSMPKAARYIAQNLKVKKIAVMYVNNDFGKPGRDAIVSALKTYGVEVVADVSTEVGQVDFSAPVVKVKQANAEAVFVYLNEEESARALRELRKQVWDKPIVGDVTLLGQKVIDLAGEAANGVVGHTEMSADAPIAGIKMVRDKFVKAYNFVPDHNGIKGYQGVYMLKAAIQKVGKFDRVAVAKQLHGMTIKVADEPGVLMDVTFDDKGDIDRDSFLIEIKGGKPMVKEILPPLGKG